MLVRDIMAQPVRTIAAAATAQEAAELMALHDVGALPVHENERIVGIVTDRDLVLRVMAPGLEAGLIPVSRIMTPDPAAVGPSASVADTARFITSVRVRRLPVVEDGRVVGMVTVDDIAQHCDDESLVLLMERRVAPRWRGRKTA